MSPLLADKVPVSRDLLTITRKAIVVEMATKRRVYRFSLFLNWLMSIPFELFPDRAFRTAQSFALGFEYRLGIRT